MFGDGGECESSEVERRVGRHFVRGLGRTC